MRNAIAAEINICDELQYRCSREYLILLLILFRPRNTILSPHWEFDFDVDFRCGKFPFIYGEFRAAVVEVRMGFSSLR